MMLETPSVIARPRFPAWLLAVLLALGTILAYQPVWHAGFIWDDDRYVTENPLLTAPDGLWRIWFSLDSPSQYFPLVYTAFRVEHALWGFNPAGYHWVNLLLHVANALLLWRLLARLQTPGAWLAAAIFALHPVQVESVAWITELKNVLMLFFFLLTLLAGVQFLDERTKRGWMLYTLSLIFYALSLCAKTTACTLPAALLLILWLKKKPITGRRLAQIAPFVALGIGMGLLTVWWERCHLGTKDDVVALGFMGRILLAARAVWFYAGKLVWPADLSFSYPRWTISAGNPLAYGWLLAAAALGAATCRRRRHAGRGFEVAVLFFVITLGPMLGFFTLYTFVFSFVADHYQYVASIGLFALFAAGLAHLAVHLRQRKPWLDGLLCLGLLLTLGTLSWRQARMYASSKTLWQTTVRRNPDSWSAHNNLGNALEANGQIDDAIGQYREVIRLKPDLAQAHYNLGNLLGGRGQIDEAIIQYKEAIRLLPNFANAHNNLGNALGSKGQIDEAIQHFQESICLKPNNAQARYNLAIALGSKGQIDEAIGELQEAIRLNPDFTEARNHLARALNRKNAPPSR